MKFRSLHLTLSVGLLSSVALAPAGWAQMDVQSAMSTPKKQGTVRIGLVTPLDDLTGSNDAQADQQVRDAEAKLLTSPTNEAVILTRSQTDQALAEARQANCDYILTASLSQQPAASTSRFGKFASLKNMQMASTATSMIPGMGNGKIAAIAGTEMMAQQLAGATHGVKANNDVTLKYTLTGVDGKVVLDDLAKTRSKSNGENVLPSLLTEEAGKVTAAAKPLAAPMAAVTTVPSASPIGALSLTTYKNYDFIPGDKVVFDDDFTATTDGDFPEKWELLSGQASVNQQAGNAALAVSSGDPAQVKARIKEKTLGSQFTLEFDFFGLESQWGPELFFNTERMHAPAVLLRERAALFIPREGDNLTGAYPDELTGSNFLGRWHHVAIAYKQPQLKVYLDQYRVLYVPDTKVAPQALVLGGETSDRSKVVFGHVRLALGGGAHYVGKQFTEAKIVSHGINFDVDAATLRPESMGSLNEIKKIMDSDPALKFEIDGHTDGTGTSAHNQELSQTRADSVKNALVGMGVDASRLTTKGFGSSKPLGADDSAEGKANNRRVEFVRL